MDTMNEATGATGVLAVTVTETARMLSVSTRTIHRLAAAGGLRIVRVTADTPRVLPADPAACP